MKIFAVLINLFALPGAGHVAIGRWKRGIPWLVLQLATWPLVLVHPVAAILALVGSRVIAAGEVAFLKPAASGWMRVALAFGGGVMVMFAASLTLRVLVAEGFKIPSGAMIPTLEIGDHIFVSKLSYRFGEPARGDVAVYVNPCEPDRDFVHRIVGMPGDTIEVRCDVLFVNGAAAEARSLKEECTYRDADERGARTDEPCVTYLEKNLDGVEYETIYGPARRDLDRLRQETQQDRPYAELEGDRDFPQIRMPRCKNGEGPGRIEEAPSPPAHACAPQRHYVVPDGHVFVMGDNRYNSSDSRSWGPVPTKNLKGKVISVWWSERSGRIGPLD